MKITIEFDSLAEYHDFIEWQATKQRAGKTPIQGSGLTYRTIQCLIGERIEFIEDALRMSDSELLGIRNFGRKSLNEIRAFAKPNI